MPVALPLPSMSKQHNSSFTSHPPSVHNSAMAKNASKKKSAAKNAPVQPAAPVKARKKAAPKKKAPAPSAAAKKSSPKTARRYTDPEKAEVVQFVLNHDKAHGRGGQSAAVKKFGVSQLTVAKWLKDAGSKEASAPATAQTKAVVRKKAPVRKRVPAPASNGTSVGDTLRRMAAIQEEIEALRGDYEGLKERL